MKLNKECEDLILGLTSIITCTYKNRPSSTATCFFCKTNSNRIILVTNKHVLYNSESFSLRITALNKLSDLTETITVNFCFKNDIVYHSLYDIATLDVTEMYRKIFNNTCHTPRLSYISENGILTDYSKLPVFQEIIMLGYPNGIINAETNHPIIRTGYIATNIKEKYNKHEMFLTDIQTVGGSSGSPILIPGEDGNVFLIGIHAESFTQHMPVYSTPNRIYHKNKIIGRVAISNNLGRAINSIIIKDMLNYYNNIQ